MRVWKYLSAWRQELAVVFARRVWPWYAEKSPATRTCENKSASVTFMFLCSLLKTVLYDQLNRHHKVAAHHFQRNRSSFKKESISTLTNDILRERLKRQQAVYAQQREK